MELNERTSAAGGLRERLIKAGMAILIEGEPLTLRGAAARAGVSHAAPAHHFPGLAGLKTAIVARALEDFADVLRGAWITAADDPFDRLIAAGQAYCAYAHNHAPLFQLMFVAADINRCDPDLVMAQLSAYMVLRELCAPFTEGQDPVFIETSVWTMVHGYAMLHLDMPERMGVAPAIAPPLAPLLRSLLRLNE